MSVEIEKTDPWWKRWFINPILKQLTQGISAEALSWTIAIGCSAGIFPIMGMTTVIAFIAATFLRLNQPVIQVVCHALYFAHLALILPLIKLGQFIHGVSPINGSVSSLLKEFFTSPWQFAQDYWLAAWHGVVAWALISIPLIFLVRLTALPVLKAAAKRIENTKEIIA